jgi:hypothetical protein
MVVNDDARWWAMPAASRSSRKRYDSGVSKRGATVPPAKLLMTWDIVPGQEQAYFEFNAKEFVPRLMQMGLRPTDSWFTLFGDAPQVCVGWVSEDRSVVRKVVRSTEWDDIQRRLADLVNNFTYKVVPATSHFQE